MTADQQVDQQVDQQCGQGARPTGGNEPGSVCSRAVFARGQCLLGLGFDGGVADGADEGADLQAAV